MSAFCVDRKGRLDAARFAAAMGDHETIGEAIQWHAAKSVECREMLRSDIHGYEPLKPDRVRQVERQLYEHESSYQILFRKQERELSMATASNKTHVNGKSGHIAKLLGITPDKAEAIANPMKHSAKGSESRAAKLRRELGLKEKPSVRKGDPEDEPITDRQAHFLGADFADPEEDIEPVIPVRATVIPQAEASPEFDAIVNEEDCPVAQVAPGRTVQEILCTPQRAKEFLRARSKELQRGLVKAAVALIADDIRNDRWVETGEPIIFDANGNLVDGQHRLEAIIAADKGVRIWVARGLPPKAMQAGGCGRKKTRADALKSLGSSQPTRSASVVGFILSFNPFDGTMAPAPSNVRSAEFYEEHPEIDNAVTYGRRLSNICYTSTAGAVAYWYFSAVDPDLAGKMFDSLTTMSDLDGMPPLKTLYAYLQKHGKPKHKQVDGDVVREQERTHVLRLLAAFVMAWNAIRAGKSLARISMPSTFPQINGLEV